MRIATKYPRIAERHFEATGRQVEVIEVKGSVELAPLIGLADGIVDLVATGRTLEENDLEVREEIVECTAPLRRQPGRPQAARRRGRRADARSCGRRRPMKVARFDWDGAEADAARGELRGLAPRARRGRRRRRRDRRARSASAATRPCCELTRALRRDRARPQSLRVDAEDAGRSGARRARPRRCARRWSSRPRTSAPSPRPSSTTRPATVELPQGQRVTVARGCRSAPPASTRRAAGPPTPRASLMCAIPARVAGVERVALASPPGPDGTVDRAGPRRGRALRSRRDLRDGRRPGDLRPRLRHRDGRRRST